MLSRTAENLFWMARYMERAEATARLLTMGQRMAILPGAHHRDEWRSVVRATGALNHFPENGQVTESDAIAFLMLDPDNSSSIRSCLLKARANAKSARTMLTQDMWEALNEGWRKLDSYDVAEARQQLRGWMRAVVFRVQFRIGNAEVSRDVDDEPGPGGEQRRRNPRRLAVFQREEDDVTPTRRLGGLQGLEGAVSERAKLWVNIAHRLPRLAATRGHPVGHVGMGEQKSKELAAGITGGADHGDTHGQAVTSSPTGRAACHTAMAARTTSTSASGSRRALNAGTFNSALT